MDIDTDVTGTVVVRFIVLVQLSPVTTVLLSLVTTELLSLVTISPVLFGTFSVGAAVACNIFAGTAAAGTLNWQHCCSYE
jgi:hypothetical protein